MSETLIEKIKQLVEDIKLALDIDEVLHEDFDYLYVEHQLKKLKELWLQKYQEDE